MHTAEYDKWATVNSNHAWKFLKLWIISDSSKNIKFQEIPAIPAHVYPGQSRTVEMVSALHVIPEIPDDPRT